MNGFKLQKRFFNATSQHLPVREATREEDRQGIDFFVRSNAAPVAVQLTFYRLQLHDIKKTAQTALRKGVPMAYVKLERTRSIQKAAALLADYCRVLEEGEGAVIVEHRGRMLHSLLPLKSLAYMEVEEDVRE